MTMWRLCSVSLLVLGSGGCDSDPGPNSEKGTLDYFPVAVGASWTYRVTDADSGAVKEKSSTVQAYEDVGGSKAGTEAFRFFTDKLTGTTVSWQQVDGAALRRLREQSFENDVLERDETYEPSKLRLDTSEEHTALGATWTESYVESAVDYSASTSGTPLAPTSKAEQWSVQATDESVTVPGGTFACLHLRRTTLGTSGNVKEFWFARDVGKVKEIGSGQTEELLSFGIP